MTAAALTQQTGLFNSNTTQTQHMQSRVQSESHQDYTDKLTNVHNYTSLHFTSSSFKVTFVSPEIKESAGSL